MYARTLLPPIRLIENWRWPQAIQLLFCFETLFILFLFAGRYKANSYLAPLFVIDPVIIFGAVSFAVGLWIIGTERLYIPGYTAVVYFCIFVAWMWMSFMWTPGAIYAQTKAIQVTLFDTFALMAGGIIMSNSRERAFRFVVAMNVFATILAIQVLVEFLRVGPGHIININGDDYLGPGRVCGLAAMTMFAYLATCDRLMTKRNIGLLALLVLYMWALLFGGGKGPLIATIVPIIMILPLGMMMRGHRVLVRRGHLIILGALVAAIATILWVMFDPDLAGKSATINRFATLFSDSQGKSDLRRTKQFWEFLQLAEGASIIGHGVGSWPILTYGADIRHHPHSLPLEIIGELGIIGLLLFIPTCVACTRLITIKRLREDPLLLGALLMTLNMALNAGTSGDLGENRYLFLTMGLLLVRPIADGVTAAFATEDNEPARYGVSSGLAQDNDDGSFRSIQRRLCAAGADHDGFMRRGLSD